jgi:hypothetical protein
MNLEEQFEKETDLKCTIPNFIYSDGYYNDDYVEWLENKVGKLTLTDVKKDRELLIDFMKKTQGKLIWGWNVGGGEKLADEYLRGNLD